MLDCLRKIACGNATEARPMLASPARAFSSARSFGLLARFVAPNSRSLSFGLKFSFSQLSSFTPLETLAEENEAGLVGSEPPPLTEPVVASGEQLLPLRVNSLRLRVTPIDLM